MKLKVGQQVTQMNSKEKNNWKKWRELKSQKERNKCGVKKSVCVCGGGGLDLFLNQIYWEFHLNNLMISKKKKSRKFLNIKYISWKQRKKDALLTREQ